MVSINGRQPEFIVNGKTVQTFGNVEIIYRQNKQDQTFSVSFINRMNNQSMSVHKFDKFRYVVEFGSPNGVDHVLSFKTVEIAVELAVLNTDITRISDEHAVKARRTFVNCIASYEPKAKQVRFSEQAWKLNKFRNRPVRFDDETGMTRTGILNVILPPSGKNCLITPDDDKSSRITLASEHIWIA